MAERLCEAQHRFVRLLSQALPFFVRWTEYNGLMICARELWRTPEQAVLNAKSGAGIANSLHCDSLAIDILLRDSQGRPLSDGARYEPLGRYWESLAGDCAWGGRFKDRPDGGHISLARGGRR